MHQNTYDFNKDFSLTNVSVWFIVGVVWYSLCLERLWITLYIKWFLYLCSNAEVTLVVILQQ